LWQLEYQRSNDVFQPCFKTGRKPRLLSLLSYLKSISRPHPPSFLLITPSHDLNLPQSTAYQTHFKQLNLKSTIMSDAARKGFGDSVSKTVTDTVNSITGQTKDTAKKNDL